MAVILIDFCVYLQGRRSFKLLDSKQDADCVHARRLSKIHLLKRDILMFGTNLPETALGKTI